MKNLIQLQTIQSCSKCNKSGYFVTATRGDYDYVYCPCCDYMIAVHILACTDQLDGFEDYFCKNCGVLFDYGCYHASGVHNGHFPGEWKDKQSGIVYQGSPQFESLDEYKLRRPDIEIIKWVCPNNALKCIFGTTVSSCSCRATFSSKKAEKPN